MHRFTLLEYLFGLYKKADLSGTLLLSVQHLMEPQKRMYELFIKLGLKPENCVIVGKNYSTHNETMTELSGLGCKVAPMSSLFDPLVSFDAWFAKNLTERIRDELARRDLSKFKRIIVLDDGGHLHLVANELCDPSLVRGVEQTSSGHHSIVRAGVTFPWTSVARSYHKLVFESPYIGRCGAHYIRQALLKLGRTDPNILNIGLGPIGRQIAAELHLMSAMRGVSFDKNWPSVRSDNRLTGMFDLIDPTRFIDEEQMWRRLAEFDVIVGNTGTSVFGESDIRKFHKDVVLISMSSSDREFPAVQFRKHDTAVHDNPTLEGRTLVNSGFPVTFTGCRNAMPPSQIEFTISLLALHVLDWAEPNMQPISMVTEALHGLWQPSRGAEEWYEKCRNDQH